jgi:hypothetical protein
VAADPDVDLFEALLQNFLLVSAVTRRVSPLNSVKRSCRRVAANYGQPVGCRRSEEVFSFERARGIDNDSHQKVFVECAPVPPTAERRDKIRRRG